MIRQVGELTGATRVGYVNGKRVLLVEYVALEPSNMVEDTYPDGYPRASAYGLGKSHVTTRWRPATEEENVQRS